MSPTTEQRREAREQMAAMLAVLRSDGYKEVGDHRMNVRAFASPTGVRVSIMRVWGSDGNPQFPTTVRDAHGGAIRATADMCAADLDEVLP